MTDALKENIDLKNENRRLEDKQRRYRLKHRRMISAIAGLTEENVNLKAWASQAIRESDKLKSLLARQGIQTLLPMGRCL